MTNLTRDGINIQDNFIRQNTVDFSPTRPGADDVAEFTVTSQNAGADRGYGSSQVNAVTPRGSNQYHGALWAYNRNSEFAANSFFNNANRVARPYLNRNQFGGKVGGPLPLPRFGEGGPSLWRDKAFFFGTWERLLTRSSSSRTRTILLPDARQGLFTYRDNANVVRQINLLSPSLGTGITAINPLIQSRFIANTPVAGNTTVAGDQLNTTGFRFNQAANNDRDAMTLRFDVDANARHSVNFVFNRNDEFTLRPDQEGNLGFGTSPVVSDASLANLYVAVWRFTPSANFTNEVRGGWLDSFPTFARNVAAPSQFFTLTSISNPEVAFLPQGRDTNTYNLQDNAEYLRGNHSFRFGFQGQLFRVNRLNDAGIVPTLTLGTNANTPQIGTAQFTNAALFPGGISTTQRTAANNLLALLGGIVGTATQTFNVTAPGSGFVPGAGLSQNYEHENYSFYFNDQWRLRPNLSINLGLRYEMFTGLRETNGVILEPNIPVGSTVEQALLNPSGFTQIAGTNLGGNKVFNNDFDNFGPVVSIAYTPNFKNKFLNGIFPDGGRTVIRGGYRKSFVNDTILRAAASEGDANSGLRGANTLTNLNIRAGRLHHGSTALLAIPAQLCAEQLAGGLSEPSAALTPHSDTSTTRSTSASSASWVPDGARTPLRPRAEQSTVALHRPQPVGHQQQRIPRRLPEGTAEPLAGRGAARADSGFGPLGRGADGGARALPREHRLQRGPLGQPAASRPRHAHQRGRHGLYERVGRPVRPRGPPRLARAELRLARTHQRLPVFPEPERGRLAPALQLLGVQLQRDAARIAQAFLAGALLSGELHLAEDAHGFERQRAVED